MTDAPERIWAKPGYDSWNAYGHWYEDATGGGTEYIRADLARPMTVAEAAKVIIAEIYRPATNEERPDWRYLSRLDLPSLRALSQGGE